MQVELNNGKVCNIRIEHVTGSEDKPVSRELLIEKFRENLNMTSISTGKIYRVLHLLQSISDSEDVGTVFGLIQKESGI